MSEEKSMLPIAGGGLIAAGVLFVGNMRALENKTSAWEETLNVLKDTGLWIFAVAFALFIGFVIYFVMKATLEKILGAFVAWDKSKEWCNSIESSFQKNTTSMDRY